jgi:hypothetical protein
MGIQCLHRLIRLYARRILVLVAVGERVLAVAHAEGDTLYVYGEGVYEGYQEVPQGTPGVLNPDGSERYPEGHTNGRILLDSGEYVWGMQCHFGRLDGPTIQAWLAKYAGNIITIPIPRRHGELSTLATTE